MALTTWSNTDGATAVAVASTVLLGAAVGQSWLLLVPLPPALVLMAGATEDYEWSRGDWILFIALTRACNRGLARRWASAQPGFAEPRPPHAPRRRRAYLAGTGDHRRPLPLPRAVTSARTRPGYLGGQSEAGVTRFVDEQHSEAALLVVVQCRRVAAGAPALMQ
jgi:hypothetical protein